MHDPKSCTRDDVLMIFFNESFYKAKVSHGVFDAWHSELPDDPQTYGELRRDMDMHVLDDEGATPREPPTRATEVSPFTARTFRLRSPLVTGAASRNDVEEVDFTDDDETEVPYLEANNVTDATDEHVEAVVMSDSDESETEAPSLTELVAGRLVVRSRYRRAVVSQTLDDDDDDDRANADEDDDDDFIDDDDDELDEDEDDDDDDEDDDEEDDDDDEDDDEDDDDEDDEDDDDNEDDDVESYSC